MYGIDQIPQMTQITPQELARVVGSAVPAQPDVAAGGLLREGGLLAAVFLLGLLLGRLWKGRRQQW